MKTSQSNLSSYKYTPTKIVDVNSIKFAYREFGSKTGVPVIFLNHLGATLDNCDPRIMDGIASNCRAES